MKVSPFFTIILCLALSGCDLLYGVRRSAALVKPIDVNCIPKTLRKVSEIQAVEHRRNEEPRSKLRGITRNILLNEILACVRKIRKSADRWSKRGGQQGYLQFVCQYVK